MIDSELEVINRASFKLEGVLYVFEVVEGDEVATRYLIHKILPTQMLGQNKINTIHFDQQDLALGLFEKIKLRSVTFKQVADCNHFMRC